MSDRFFEGDPFPDDFFPGMNGDGESEGMNDEFERNYDLDERELNQRLLIETVKMLDMFNVEWKSRDFKTQKKMIRDSYLFYQGLLDGTDLGSDEDDDSE